MEPTISVIHVAREAEGGMRKHVLQLLGGLDRTRFRLGLVASHSLTEPVGDTGVDVLSLSIGDGLGVRSLLSLPRITRFAGRFSKPRIVHAHGYTAAVLGVAVAKLSGSRLVYTAHNLLSPSSSRVNRAAAMFASARASRIIAVSEGVKDSLIKAGADPTRITVIPNGAESCEPRESFDRAAKLAEMGVPSEAKVVLCVARLTPVKGVRFLIQAVPLLKATIPDVSVVIAGDGPEMGFLKDLNQSVNGDSGVVFLGHRDDVPELLPASDVVAIPSVQEGQGLVALEAMAARRPVVATSVGGLTEMIRDGVTGLLVAPEDSSALASALSRVLLDTHLADDLACAGRDFVNRNMSVEKMISATEAIYRSCVGL
jgi:glycosyltransferase involved in cell wall biosynthesis